MGPITSTEPLLTRPFCLLVSSTTSTVPSGLSSLVSAQYFRKKKVPSPWLLALDAILVYASQYSWRLLCAPMDLLDSFSFSSCHVPWPVGGGERHAGGFRVGGVHVHQCVGRQLGERRDLVGVDKKLQRKKGRIIIAPWRRGLRRSCRSSAPPRGAREAPSTRKPGVVYGLLDVGACVFCVVVVKRPGRADWFAFPNHLRGFRVQGLGYRV